MTNHLCSISFTKYIHLAYQCVQFFYAINPVKILVYESASAENNSKNIIITERYW